MAEELTREQKQAVYDRGGRLLVSAAAGSGKTKVLVDRLMQYLLDPVAPANIDDFLMITYTKAAASELRAKIAAKLSEKVAEDPDNRHLRSQLQRLYLTKISTVHAFCGDVLRDYAYRLDLSSDFRVADENECRELRETVLKKLLDRCYENTREFPDFLSFVDSQGLGRDDRLVPEIIQKVYDSARCHLDPAVWLQQCMDQVDTREAEDAAQTVYGAFLLQRLQQWLDLQIPALERSAQAAAGCAGGEKVHTLLMDTVFQLQNLRRADSWEQVCSCGSINFGRLLFPKQFDDEDLKERIKAVREACKKELEKQLKPFADSSRQVLQDLAACQGPIRGLMQLVDAFAKDYEQAKKGRHVLDFGDLEHKMLDLLLGKQRGGPTAAAREIGNRFREVMVDEYQDSNQVQDAIYCALTEARQNLFLVGDVKQSIYQFRLADPSIFLQKYHTYLPADDAQAGQGRKVLLSKNFRSGGGVLSACNDVFSLCMRPGVGGLYYGPEEALNEGIPHIPMQEPEAQLYCIDVQEHTYPEEAAFVADHIRKLLDGNHFVRDGQSLRPIRPEDIAILLRSPGSAGSYFYSALDRVGIRYATGGGVDLLKTPEVATLRSLLQAVHNPRLDIPLIAAMASPLFGFTADDLAAIRSLDREAAFYDTLCRSADPRAVEFVQLLSELRQTMRFQSLTGLLEQILLHTRMEDVYAAMDAGTLRLANIQAFYQLSCDFEAGGNWDLGRFLEYLETMEEKGLISAGEQSAPGCVTIMSIHKSKGLEFPVVFLCGLGREFNMESQREAVLCHKQLGLGLSAVDHANRLRYPTVAKRAISAMIGQESISEEMRVLYVAMTRARDQLIMTYASARLQKDLTELVQQLNAGAEELLIRQAVCPGEWVLLTALHRSEAGELFALGGRVEAAYVRDIPWQIKVVTAPALTAVEHPQAQQRGTVTEGLVEQLRQSIAFRYAHDAAMAAPSKQTATERKGRVKDEETAQDAPQPIRQRQWRKPGFLSAQLQGKDYGNAYHLAMQHLELSRCESEAEVSRQLQQLVQQNYLSADQARLVRPEKITAFFHTELGQKLASGVPCVREFKFSILEDGAFYDAGLAGEEVLLQGVVDCALLEEDGITVVDFKTDYVTEETLDAAVDRYRGQVRTYAQAMERIYEKPIKQALLYFFHLDTFWQV